MVLVLVYEVDIFCVCAPPSPFCRAAAPRTKLPWPITESSTSRRRLCLELQVSLSNCDL